jgi:hypothetical protein
MAWTRKNKSVLLHTNEQDTPCGKPTQTSCGEFYCAHSLDLTQRPRGSRPTGRALNVSLGREASNRRITQLQTGNCNIVRVVLTESQIIFVGDEVLLTAGTMSTISRDVTRNVV